MTAPSFPELVEHTVARYRDSGRFVQGFVRGKLKHDPVYRELLNLRVPCSDGILLDLGCGRGIALAVIATARAATITPGISDRAGLRLLGIEQRLKEAHIARTALGTAACISAGDIRRTALPRCRIALLLDVLLYLDPREQDDLLQRIADALEPDGIVIMREADRAGGWRFRITQWAERLCSFARGEWRTRCHYRSREEWNNRLGTLGFMVETYPMSTGTPFANILFVARRPPSGPAAPPHGIPEVER